MDDYLTVGKQASFGELDGVKKIIEEGGTGGDEQDERGFTPLCWAARNGHIEVLEYLISQGFNKETASFGGLRPLHHACNKNLEKIIRLLIKEGASVNAPDENGDSPLMYASARGVLNIVTAILDAGGDPKIANSQGVTAIHKAATFGQMGIVKKLADSDICDVNAKDSAGDTPLHCASRCGFPMVVKYLLNGVANPAIKNAAGQSAKDVAANPVMEGLFADQQ